MTRVAVTGANGFVGQALLPLLAERGDSPIAVLREGRSCPPGVPSRKLAALDEASLRSAFEGASAVVHAAAVVHRPGASDEEYRRFNVEGTRAVVAAALAVGVKKLVFLSTIKVVGEEPGVAIDEDTPPRPEGAYATTKLEAERIVAEAPSLSPITLRLCPVYGRGDKGNVRAMAVAIARRRFLLPGDGSTRKSLVHVSTVAELIHAAVHSPRVGVYVVADRHAPSMRELSELLALALGRPPPRSAPAPLLRAVAGLGDAVLGALGRRSNLGALVHKSLLSTVCSPAKAERELGVECMKPLASMLDDEVAWLRAEGALGASGS